MKNKQLKNKILESWLVLLELYEIQYTGNSAEMKEIYYYATQKENRKN